MAERTRTALLYDLQAMRNSWLLGQAKKLADMMGCPEDEQLIYDFRALCNEIYYAGALDTQAVQPPPSPFGMG